MNPPAWPVYEAVEWIAARGFEFVDLTVEPPGAEAFDPARMRELLARTGLDITGHTDPNLPWAYAAEPVREAACGEIARAMKLLAASGARTVSVHPCYSSPPSMNKRLVEGNVSALRGLVREAEDAGVELLFENFVRPFGTAEEIERVLNEVDGLGLHFDVAHAFLVGGMEEVKRFFERFGWRTRHLHFSDNKGSLDDHLALGDGWVDWRFTLKLLRGSRYDGTLTLEVFCADKALLMSSKKRLEELLRSGDAPWSEMPEPPSLV